MSVTIVNGVNSITASLAGKTVAEVRAMLAQALNIDPNAVPMVDGQQVEGSHVLGDGQEVEFVKPSGTKG